VPLFYTERWIHLHLFGIGYLFTNDKNIATRLFYVFFLPGIVIHELIQYLVAGALNVPLKTLFAWPEEQENGTMRLNFIVVEQKKIDPIRSAIVAASPFLVMSLLIWFISTRVLDMHDFMNAVGSVDIERMSSALGDLFSKSDFIVWLYLLFAIANTMIPQKEDARGWPIILGVLGIIAVVMVVVGADDVLIDTLGGPVTETLGLVNSALASVLLLNLGSIALFWALEEALAYWRGFRMTYDTGAPSARSTPSEKREPGSDAPYPRGMPLPSIYLIDLPLPDPDKVRRGARPARPTIGAPSVAPAAPGAPAFASRIRETTGTPAGELGEESESASSAPPARPSFERRPIGGSPTAPGGANPSARPAPHAEDGETVAPPARPTFERRPIGGSPTAPGAANPSARPTSSVQGEDGESAPPARPAFERRPIGSPPAAERPAGGAAPPSARPTFERRPIGNLPANEEEAEDAPAPQNTRPTFERRPFGGNSPGGFFGRLEDPDDDSDDEEDEEEI
jgi:hypothetical protein